MGSENSQLGLASSLRFFARHSRAGARTPEGPGARRGLRFSLFQAPRLPPSGRSLAQLRLDLLAIGRSIQAAQDTESSVLRGTVVLESGHGR